MKQKGNKNVRLHPMEKFLFYESNGKSFIVGIGFNGLYGGEGVESFHWRDKEEGEGGHSAKFRGVDLLSFGKLYKISV